MITAWELARAWPGAELVIIEDGGHTGSPAAVDAVIAAADKLFGAINGRDDPSSWQGS